MCIEKFGVKHHWLVKKARALRELGRNDDAEREFASLAEIFPDYHAGFVALGWFAQQRKDWARAEAMWRRCLEQFSDAQAPQWTANRAEALRNLGRLEEAELLLQGLTRQHPANANFANALKRVTAQASQKASQAPATSLNASNVATRETDRTTLSAGALPVSLTRNDRIAAGERLLNSARHAVTVEELELLFRATEIADADSCGSIWTQLLVKTRAIAASGTMRSRCLELELRLLLALGKFEQFAKSFEQAGAELRGRPLSLMLGRVAERLRTPRSKIAAEAKIFGIGLPRTGTRSLVHALNGVGIDAVHQINPLTFRSVRPNDRHLFGASADVAASQEFEMLYYSYPNASFILTRRPPDDWARVTRSDCERRFGVSTVSGLRFAIDRLDDSEGVAEFAACMNVDSFDAAYNGHLERVRRFFSDKPPGKLLEIDFSAGDSWPELCVFLGRHVPQEPFPHEK